MSLQTKTDRFGFADGTTLKVKSFQSGRANGTVEGSDENGDTVACDVLEDLENPSIEYELLADLKSTTAKDIVLGGVTTVQVRGASKYFCLTSVTLSAGAGEKPTVAAAGHEVCKATPNGTYTLEDALAILAKNVAQILAGAFTLAGTKCHLQNCTATFSVDFDPRTVDGTMVGWDVTNGRIEVTAQVSQYGTTEPTLAAVEGWTCTVVPVDSQGDSEYMSWNATFTKFLSRDSED